MIETSLAYTAPDTLEEALTLLGSGNHRLLVGDPAMVRRLYGSGPYTLVSLRRIPGLDAVTADKSRLRIGVLAGYGELARHDALSQFPVLAGALATIQDPHLRNHSNLGAALQQGGPEHGPVLAALLALDARATVLSRSGETERPLADLLPAGRSPLTPGELVKSLDVTATPEMTSCYLALEELPGRYCSRGMAMVVQENAERLETVRLVAAGFTEQPLHLTDMEAALTGQQKKTLRIEVYVSDLKVDEPFFSERESDPDFDRHLLKVLLRRTLNKCFGS